MKVTFGSTLALVASLASAVNAHTYLSKLNIAGKQYDEGVCIRPYPTNRNFPIKNVLSTDMTCGVGASSTSASQNCPAEAGSTVTVEWHHDNDSASDDIIDPSHLGPCMVYMAPLSSNGVGDVWFKIFEDGYDASSKQWCVNKLIANKGKLDITLPADIKAGDYLLRTEVIALHEADTDYAQNSARGAQFYVNCAQLSVTGSGSAVPNGVAIPGIYKSNTPGVLFNLYSSYTSYPIPGPAVYVAGSVSGGNSSSSEEPAASTTPVAASTTPAASSTEYTTSEPTAAPATTPADSATEYTTTSANDSTAQSYSSVEDYSTSTESAAPTSSAPVYATSTLVVPGKCH
ncbi:hypothetical protein LPJ73_001056 [Coemansia sp. RSA 2703]|nr:hypothetical protein LPJ73_001056 [Coemansia sp. RSA 2703]KAJ2379346.1 hypothetical protein IW150_000226 [Coemansia sp. RSA 2607]KAJ2398334.1 hypothetical protein GGI05_000142 [Coemansia sp. RSA 2603]